MPLRLVAVLLLLLTACAPAAPSPTPTAKPAGGSAPAGKAEGILVLAASDLQFALAEVADRYAAGGRARPTITFGSTGNFAQQIENGAPADLFFAADRSFVAGLAAKQLVVEDSRQVYGVGRIVIAPAKSTTIEVKTLEDLLRTEVRKVAIANPEHAPYGRAAQQALQASGLWERVEPKLVLGENISQTFQLVNTGNADAGIVALAVVLGVPGTPYTLVAGTLHAPLAQEAAVLARSARAAEARDFLAFVNGPEGRPIMKRFGFALPGEV